MAGSVTDVDAMCDLCADADGRPRHDPGFCSAANQRVTCSRGHVIDHFGHSPVRMGKLIGMSHTSTGSVGHYPHAVDENGRVWRLSDHGPDGWSWVHVPVMLAGSVT